MKIGDRGFRFVAAALLIASVVLRFFLTLYRRFNADEFQHLHAGWMIHSGYLPYRDFWENHTPLFHYFLAPFFVLPEGIPLILIIRALLSATSLLILWQTYRLARIEHDHRTAVLSVIILSFSVLFLQKTIEIRPDQFLVIFWLAAFLLFFHSDEPLRIAYSGILLGLAFLFSPKALFCLAAMIIGYAVHLVVQRSWSVKNLWRLFLLCAGFFLPPAICGLWFWQKGAFAELIDKTIIENFSYPFSSRPLYLLSMQHLVFFLMAASGLIVYLRKEKRLQSHIFFGVTALFLFLVFVLLMPAPFPQTALIFLPFFAIYAGIAGKQAMHLLQTGKVLPAAAAGLCAVVIPVGTFFIDQPSTASNHPQLDLIQNVLKITKKDEVIFDGNTIYVFRPQAYYYGSLVDGIRERMHKEVIQPDLVSSLKRSGCRYVIYDDRVSRLPDNVQRFIRNNYLPADVPDFYVAGRKLYADSFSGSVARFQIAIPQTYQIRVSNSASFLIDGKPYVAPLFLPSGRHIIVSEKQLEQIVIRAEY